MYGKKNRISLNFLTVPYKHSSFNKCLLASDRDVAFCKIYRHLQAFDTQISVQIFHCREIEQRKGQPAKANSSLSYIDCILNQKVKGDWIRLYYSWPLMEYVSGMVLPLSTSLSASSSQPPALIGEIIEVDLGESEGRQST